VAMKFIYGDRIVHLP